MVSIENALTNSLNYNEFGIKIQEQLRNNDIRNKNLISLAKYYIYKYYNNYYIYILISLFNLSIGAYLYLYIIIY